MSWQSDHPQVGNGWMRIADTSGMDKIDLELGFDGFDGKSQSWYLLREVDGGTEDRPVRAVPLLHPARYRQYRPVLG